MIMIPISIGELCDKLSILIIKLKKIIDPQKLVNIQIEYDLLDKELKEFCKKTSTEKGVALLLLIAELNKTNLIIWNVEDSIREHESCQDFSNDFIQLARNVYIFNDRRAKIKREINDLFESEIKEEKSYKAY